MPYWGEGAVTAFGWHVCVRSAQINFAASIHCQTPRQSSSRIVAYCITAAAHIVPSSQSQAMSCLHALLKGTPYFKEVSLGTLHGASSTIPPHLTSMTVSLLSTAAHTILTKLNEPSYGNRRVAHMLSKPLRYSLIAARCSVASLACSWDCTRTLETIYFNDLDRQHG